MKSKSVMTPFVISLFVIPAMFALILGFTGKDPADRFKNLLFTYTVAIEVVALAQAMKSRRLFSKSDSGHLTWSFIVAFLVVRLIAETRLLSLTLIWTDLAKNLEAASTLRFFYVAVLRYLYTVSDVLFVAALFNTVKTYRSTGLKFELVARDYIYIALLWVIPVITYVNRANLGLTGLTGPDNYIPTYRLVAVFVGAVIASLCVVVRRYAVQMGGGAVSRIWNMAVLAGIARDASFLALALLSLRWAIGAQFIEQYLLWTFSGCWL